MSTLRPGQLTLRTPEGIAFTLKLAGPTARLLAWFIDQMIVSIILTLFMLTLGTLDTITGGMLMGLILIGYFVIDTSYAIATEWLMRGQTPGKRLLRLRVMDEEALPLRFHQVVVRNLLRFVDRLPLFYLVGVPALFFSRRAQRLGDFAAGTIVVHEPRLEQPALDRLMADKYNSLRAHPHIAARLRARVSPAEAQLALGALMRREALELEARLALFADLADHFRQLAPFPQASTDGLSDEQYVRNVVDLLYRK